MQIPSLIAVIFIVCPIAALLFVVRLVAAPFSSKVRSQMQKHPIIHIVWASLAFVGLVAAMNPASLTGGTRGRYMNQQNHYADAFKAGDTNVPLFAMDWFAPTVHFCRVNQSGKGSARRDVGHAIQAGVSISLDETNLLALVSVINQLPPPAKHSLPIERQIVVGCIRSNQWFRAVYDRADIPKELEQVSQITGAYLPWYIPTVVGRPVANGNGSEFFCVANETPIAVSAGWSFLQAWELNNAFGMASSQLKVISGKLSLFEYEHPIAVSPDGKTIAVATEYELCAVDWKNRKVLWKAGALEHEAYSGKHLAIGDNGRTLFAAGAHTIERWDLLSGQNHSVLMANEANMDGVVRFLKTSRDGKILIAGFGLRGNQRPQSIAVWEVGKNAPALKFEEKEGANADLSPDGEWIALSRFGTEKLVLFKWRTGERKEVQLRNSGDSYSVLWSPDGKRLAAYVDTYPASIIIYDTANWKPIAHWECGTIGFGSEFSFGSNGTLYQIRNNELNALDVQSLKSLNAD